MQAIIMAAGMGTRLKDLTKYKPKALLKVLGKELLMYVMEFLDKDIVEEIIIVVGYMGEKVRNFLKTRNLSHKISVVENPDFNKGNILSLLKALPKINDDFILLNVDHIYYNPKIFSIITQNIKGITAVCDFDRVLGKDDMKVLIEGDKIIKISKKLLNYTGGYVGITIVPREKLTLYKNFAHKIADLYNGEIHVEQILQALADSGEPIFYKDISNLGWVEIDTLEDLKIAEEKLRKFYNKIFI